MQNTDEDDYLLDLLKKGIVEDIDQEIEKAGGYWAWQQQLWDKQMGESYANPGRSTLPDPFCSSILPP